MKTIYTFLFLSFFILYACQEKPLYKRTFSEEEKLKLTDQMTNGLHRFYQGSVAEVMILEEAISLRPEQADLWREKGAATLKRGMAADFHEFYGKAAQYDPAGWLGYRGYMYLYFYRDYERAIKDFNTLDDLTPDIVDYPQSTSIHFMRGICYLQLGEYKKALSFWDRHLVEELRTTTEEYIDPKTYLFQGITYWKMGDFEKANSSFERGLKNHPYNADLWLWTAKMAIQNGDSNMAKQALEKAQTQFDKEYQNYRPYVEEFFQMYQSDIDELKLEPVLN